MSQNPFDLTQIDANWIDMFQQISDAVTNLGIFICDMSGKILVYNKCAALFDRTDHRVVIGSDFKKIYIDEDGGIIPKVMSSGKAIVNHKATYATHDGYPMTCIDSVYPIWIDGSMRGIIAVNRYDDKTSQTLQNAAALISREKQEMRNLKNGTHFLFDDILGHSALIQEAVKKAKRAAKIQVPVFLLGETGTGKEMFAQSIHNASDNKDEPFVAINCAAIPVHLMEGLLFGTVKGAFTGAETKEGLFEQAGNGTVFLDEINSMPTVLQSKLLRVIQEKKLRRLGGNSEISVNCRIISSCNQPPLQCIQDGYLRDDLYYRLSVVNVQLPALRDRKEDVQDYVAYFAKKYSLMFHQQLSPVEPEFIDAMTTYEWPGNVRELEHVMESIAVMLDPGAPFSCADLPEIIRQQADIPHKAAVTPPEPVKEEIFGENFSLKDFLNEQEKKYIIAALQKNAYNISRAAVDLKISRGQLQYQMEKLDIPIPSKRDGT